MNPPLKKCTSGAIVMFAALFLISCGSSDDHAPVAQQPTMNIVETAIADGRFTTLVTALQAADLDDDLAGPGPFTVFAPTDDAFAALPEGTIEALLADIPALTDILLYHVVAGEAFAADVVGLESVTTVQGSDISITVEDGNVFLNDSVQVIITDIDASNGVIHVIDFVLLPPFSVTNNGAANLNFRAGPGLDQTIIDTFPIGAKGAALARSLDSEWVQINYEGQIGWVFAPLAELSGDISELNVDANIVEIAVADGRFALEPVFVLFADNDHQTVPAVINSLQLRDAALDLWIAVLEDPTRPEYHYQLGRVMMRMDLPTQGTVHLHEVDGGHWLNADNPDALQRLLMEHTPPA